MQNLITAGRSKDEEGESLPHSSGCGYLHPRGPLPQPIETSKGSPKAPIVGFGPHGQGTDFEGTEMTELDEAPVGSTMGLN